MQNRYGAVKREKECTACARVLDVREFYRDVKSADGRCTRCRYCRRHVRNAGSNRMNSHLRVLLRRSRHSAARRGRMDGGRGRRMEHTIDMAWILRQMDLQEGRCAYSGFRMDSKCHSLYQASLERRDNTLGYVPENVILVCNVFNIGHGRAMSVPKFRHLVSHCDAPLSNAEISAAPIASAAGRLVSHARNGSPERGILFDLSVADVVDMYREPCGCGSNRAPPTGTCRWSG